ncbi:TPA_asm: DUF1642 domain-containing protein [Listeria monocytogenes]|nr:DUF1642 domain-containing protein [Listeria monocytogenes]HAB6527662.1 DUF1642 domain-containing protein [Listeria monocytogenes]HAC4868720.1 DUF1642 domain-containing protein [Listeria monocytogenes]HAC4930846.1 DUF1642 domain-containing protein [Listeria monocytogenes]HBZ6406638.1 DUF1642 domain-containing protein [Listeria monocytogenes]
MKFREGDKVEFIYRNKKSAGEINGVYPGTQEVSIKQSDSPVDLLFSDKAVAKVEEPELVVVPQCVADWIEQKKANGDQLYIAMDKSWESMNYTVSDWLEEGEDRYNKFARAWMDGYEVEKEPLYYVRFINNCSGYLNVRNDERRSLSDSVQNDIFKTQFTEAEIREMDERYWQFAVPVRDLEGEDNE